MWKFVYIALGCVQNMTMGGILFGWTSIISLLLSSPSEGGAGLTNESVHTMFVIASFCSFLGPLCLGILLDIYGPRICSTVSIIIIVFGFLLMGFAEEGSIHPFIIAMCFIAFGGNGVQSAIIHLSNLFPTWKASATAIITGSFQLSFFIFYLFDQLWAVHGWRYQSIFQMYAVVCAFNAIISLFMWPDKPYRFVPPSTAYSSFKLSSASLNVLESEINKGPSVTEKTPLLKPKPIRSKKKIKTGLLRAPSTFHLAPLVRTPSPDVWPTTHSDANSGSCADDQLVDGECESDIKMQSLWIQVTSPLYLELVAYFTVGAFWSNFYVGTVDTQLGDTLQLDLSDRNWYGRNLTLSMTLGALAIPVVGVIMDTFGFPVTSLLASLFGIAWTVNLLFGGEGGLLTSFVFYTLFRTFLMTFTFAYMADTLGFDYFGILVGVAFAIAGFVSFIQIWLRDYAIGTCHIVPPPDHCNPGRWDIINWIMFGTVILLPLFSIRDYFRRDQQTKRLLQRANLNLDSTESTSEDCASWILRIAGYVPPEKEVTESFRVKYVAAFSAVDGPRGAGVINL